MIMCHLNLHYLNFLLHSRGPCLLLLNVHIPLARSLFQKTTREKDIPFAPRFSLFYFFKSVHPHRKVHLVRSSDIHYFPLPSFALVMKSVAFHSSLKVVVPSRTPLLFVALCDYMGCH